MIKTDAVVGDLVESLGSDQDPKEINLEQVKDLQEYKLLDQKIGDYNENMEMLQK